MSAGPLTEGEFAAWRALAQASRRWLATPSTFHAGRLERFGRKAWRVRVPPPWEAPAMSFWRDFAAAAKALDRAALEAHAGEADRRLDALAATRDQPTPYYLKD